jgi:hypothetical protein
MIRYFKLNFGDVLHRREPTSGGQAKGPMSGIAFDYFRVLAGEDGLIKPNRKAQPHGAQVRGSGAGDSHREPRQVCRRLTFVRERLIYAFGFSEMAS